MLKGILVFSAAFGICAVLGSSGTGCSAEDEQPGCAEAPNRPPAVSGLRFDWVTTEGDAAATIDPVGGTLASTGDTIVIRYRQDTVMHEVVYAIDEPWSSTRKPAEVRHAAPARTSF